MDLIVPVVKDKILFQFRDSKVRNLTLALFQKPMYYETKKMNPFDIGYYIKRFSMNGKKN